jgi:hypothetical protein
VKTLKLFLVYLGRTDTRGQCFTDAALESGIQPAMAGFQQQLQQQFQQFQDQFQAHLNNRLAFIVEINAEVIVVKNNDFGIYLDDSLTVKRDKVRAWLCDQE